MGPADRRPATPQRSPIRAALVVSWPVLIAAGLFGLVQFPASRRSSAAAGAPAPVPANPTERRATLFYTAEVHGAIEPCGCSSDPLGDVSRLAALIADARKNGGKNGGKAGTGVALMDAGGLLYPEGAIARREREAADLRADFLATEFQRMGLLGAALGEADTAAGAERVRPPRLASNLTAGPTLIGPPRVHQVGGIAVGLLGIADPAVAPNVGARARDAAETARQDVDGLRRAGAEVVVLLAAVDKSGARKLARESGADVIVVGKNVGAGMPRLERVGSAFVVAPAADLERVGRLEIVLREARGRGAVYQLQDGGGPEAATLRREEIDRAIERIRGRVAAWSNPAASKTGASSDGADARFVAEKRRELTELEAERRRLEAPWTPPPSGNYVVDALIPLRRTLRRDPAVVAGMKKLDRKIAAVNLSRATPPPPPESGRASYVGINRCTGCHAAATSFWKHTVHAHAWKTLVDGGKQADYKCVGCHVTGFGQVGGSALGFTTKLESVQCETCHGPGSLHVAGEGNEEPVAIKRDTAEDVCRGCHTEQHSDTFQYEAYLRDVLGAGHGAKRREKLGPGPTGHELRAAAVARAKRAGAEQVKKM